MEIERSEIQFVATKDAFLYMTIFVSIKTLYSLRISCKKINSWLSDPTTFSWKLRIQNTFPHSYEDILKQTMNDQVQRLLKFDSLVEEGHSVSCCNLDNLIQRLSQAAPRKRGSTQVKQLPWQKNIFILSRNDGIRLYDANTASVGQMVDLGTDIFYQLLNRTDRQIGFIRNRELKLYRHEGTKLILDRQMVLNLDQIYSALAIFGDYIFFKFGFGYQIHSIWTNSVVFELNLGGVDFFEVVSEHTPLVYIVYSNHDDKYYIRELNLLTWQSKECPLETQEFAEVTEISLIENDRERYLKIYCLLYQFGVQVYDVVQQKLIVNEFYADAERDQYEYYCDFWDSLTYNPEMRYYCTSHEEKITIKESKESLYSQDSAEVVFSRRFLQSSVRMDTIKWLTNDTVTVCLQKSFQNGLRSVFISATKGKVIGFINGDMTVFSDGEKAIAFDRHMEDVYIITFTTASDRDTNLKRKLEDPDQESERKKPKLSIS